MDLIQKDGSNKRANLPKANLLGYYFYEIKTSLTKGCGTNMKLPHIRKTHPYINAQFFKTGGDTAISPPVTTDLIT